MILVDYREDSENKGSKGLWDDLKKTSLPIEQTSLEGGDLMFVGNGPADSDVSVGVEFKKLRDLISSIRTKRLQAVQIPKLLQYDFRFIIVEGEWRHDEQGRVTLRSGWREWKPAPGAMSASELDRTLLGLTLRCGIFVQQTLTRRDTLRWIESLYRDFTDKKWDEHTSHSGVYRPATIAPLSDFRATVSTFPGVGIKTSKLVEDHFRGRLRNAVKAGVGEWSKIDGIGTKKAMRIVDFLEGE